MPALFEWRVTCSNTHTSSTFARIIYSPASMFSINRTISASMVATRSGGKIVMGENCRENALFEWPVTCGNIHTSSFTWHISSHYVFTFHLLHALHVLFPSWPCSRYLCCHSCWQHNRSFQYLIFLRWHLADEAVEIALLIGKLLLVWLVV